MGALREFELEGWQDAAATYDGFAGATRLFVPAPGGTFAFTVWAAAEDNTAWRIIFDAVRACGRLDVPMPAGNDAAATRENFSRLMVGARFDPATLRSELLTCDWRLPPDADL